MNRQRSTPEFNDKDVVHELHALDRETLARLLFHGWQEFVEEASKSPGARSHQRVLGANETAGQNAP